ncbi:protein CURLY FLAG LEAF 1-like [Musa acuminata AAA Group]|uniref:protein CURLY FLAG LEAF 1-like n=1 Tax=Musa acuminata AAA Group TaxID=214697 RepID=UPI0031D897D9
MAKKEIPFGGEKERKVLELRAVNNPELSLGGSLSLLCGRTNSSSSESDADSRRKRKQTWSDPVMIQTSIDLQINDPLPLDWEQCLDLRSGRMYYLNRKTLRRSWTKPKEQKLDLELNISSLPTSDEKANSTNPDEEAKKYTLTGNMVAVVCINCHLLVMLFTSSPSCPNCRHMNSLPLPAQYPMTSGKLETVNSPKTLSLLH